MPAPDFASLTAEILAAVEANPGAPELPWRRSNLHLPRNALTKNSYRGVNVLALWASASRQSFTVPVWASYRQWAAMGAQVRRGEKGTPIIYYQAPRNDTDGFMADQPRRPMARSSVVFSAEQVSGYQLPASAPPSTPWDRFTRADEFIRATGAEIRHGGDEAYYAPVGDFIQLPVAESFIETQTSSARDGYYATAFHELGHWTGAKSRLDRDLTGRFGSQSYAMEELVAELTAAFACAALQVTPTLRPDHSRYIANWTSVLREDPRAISTAAAKAGEAFDYLNPRTTLELRSSSNG